MYSIRLVLGSCEITQKTSSGLGYNFLVRSNIGLEKIGGENGGVVR